MNFKYFVNEGFRSFWINGIMSIATVVIVTACLMMFGTYIILAINLDYFAKQLQGQYEVVVFISKETTDKRTREIGDEIGQIPNIESVTFVPKDVRLREFESAYEDDMALDNMIFQDNPVRDSYSLVLKSMESWEEVEIALNNIPEVQKIRSSNEMISKIQAVSNVVQWISWILMAFMGFISVFIISNTIRITVFARRRDINIMKFVGATDWFIRWPFIIEGVIIGLVSGLIALLIITQCYGVLYNALRDWLGDFITLKSIGEISGWVVSVLLALGIVMGAGGSAIAVKKHLHV